MRTKHVTVGIDESRSATTAMAWGAGFADSIDVPLRAIHAWRMPLIAHLPESVGGLPTPEYMIGRSTTLIDKIVSEAGLDPADVTNLTPNLPPGEAIVNQTAEDLVVVTGRTGHGKSRFARLLLGTTTRYAANHARGPLVVVPDDCPWVPAPRVVIGVDGSDESLDALAWAIDEMPADAALAARHVVPAWGDPYARRDDAFPEEVAALLQLEVIDWIDRARQRSIRPDRPVAAEVVVGEPRAALAPVPADSDLLDSDILDSDILDSDIVIIGHRSRNAVAERLLSSVADHLIRDASVPVIVHRAGPKN